METKELVSRMKRHIRSLAYFNQDRDDLLQDALIKVLRSRASRYGNGSGWLYRVARSTVIDAHRRSVRELKHYSGYVDTCSRVCDSDGNEEEIENNVIYHQTYLDKYLDVAPEDLDAMPEILASLSFEHQEVLLLYARDLTYQEIAHMIGLKVGTVRSRVHYARKKAHKLIEERMKKDNAEVKNLIWQH